MLFKFEIISMRIGRVIRQQNDIDFPKNTQYLWLHTIKCSRFIEFNKPLGIFLFH